MPVITVNGKIDKEDLGITLPHEHIFIDLTWQCKVPDEVMKRELFEQKINIRNLGMLRRNPYIMKDAFRLSDMGLAIEEILEFKKAGGATIVDVSSVGTGRSPVAIRDVSKITGVNIVMGCGYYLEKTLPDDTINKSEEILVKEILNEVHFGVRGTNIRTGIIGEIGIGFDIGGWERKNLRISAQVHKETGLPITVHIMAVPVLPGFSKKLNGIEVLNILEKFGVNLNKVVISHVDAKIDLEYIKNIIKFGAYVEFDHFGKEFYYDVPDFLLDRDMDRINAIKELIDEGYEKNILISQDICLKTDLINYGGCGYSNILNNIVPIMLKKGIKQESIRTIMIDNPKNLLDVEYKYF